MLRYFPIILLILSFTKSFGQSSVKILQSEISIFDFIVIEICDTAFVTPFADGLNIGLSNNVLDLRVDRESNYIDSELNVDKIVPYMPIVLADTFSSIRPVNGCVLFGISPFSFLKQLSSELESNWQTDTLFANDSLYAKCGMMSEAVNLVKNGITCYVAIDKYHKPLQLDSVIIKPFSPEVLNLLEKYVFNFRNGVKFNFIHGIGLPGDFSTESHEYEGARFRSFRKQIPELYRTENIIELKNGIQNLSLMAEQEPSLFIRAYAKMHLFKLNSRISYQENRY